jgi:hypothetical protein
MLYCPFLSPVNFSNLLPGGTRKSLIDVAASSKSNFRRATQPTNLNQFVGWLKNNETQQPRCQRILSKTKTRFVGLKADFHVWLSINLFALLTQPTIYHYQLSVHFNGLLLLARGLQPLVARDFKESYIKPKR